MVLNDSAAGPRGPLSRATQVAGDLTRMYGGRIRLTYTHALNGFAAEMPQGVALAMSLDPRVAFVEEDGIVTKTDTQYMSLEGPAHDVLDLAVSNSIASGVTHVIAAGNGNVDAATRSPARVSEAVTVGATDINDMRATWNSGGRSNYGAVLDVFAPGKEILSAWIGSDTATNTIEGTSMAAPHVAGIVARHLESNPDASPAELSSGPPPPPEGWTVSFESRARQAARETMKH